MTWAHLQSAAAGIAALLKPDINKAVMDLLLCRKREEPKETYRVAVQSVSAVLEGETDEDGRANENAPEEKGQDANKNDPEQALPKRISMKHMILTQPSFGDPTAYWPSQRPMRQNPRLLRHQQECTETKGRPCVAELQCKSSTTMSCSSSRREEHHDTRSVAKSLILALKQEESTKNEE